MTWSDGFALFLALAVLAAVPSVSVAAVASRSMASGFLQGAWVTAGIVVADILFIMLAVFGLAVLAEAMGDLYHLLYFLAAGYLFWLAFHLWQRRGVSDELHVKPVPATTRASFTMGLLITLADQKAILFYFAFLPAFLDLGGLSWFEILSIMVIATVAVGSVKLVYAAMAGRLATAVGPSVQVNLHRLAAFVMALAGVYLLVRM